MHVIFLVTLGDWRIDELSYSEVTRLNWLQEKSKTNDAIILARENMLYSEIMRL